MNKINEINDLQENYDEIRKECYDLNQKYSLALRSIKDLIRTGQGFMDAVRSDTKTAYPWAGWEIEVDKAMKLIEDNK